MHFSLAVSEKRQSKGEAEENENHAHALIFGAMIECVLGMDLDSYCCN